MLKTEYQVKPCYFSDSKDYITFKSGESLSVFLQNTDYDCDVKVKTILKVVPNLRVVSKGFDEYGAYGENNGPLR